MEPWFAHMSEKMRELQAGEWQARPEAVQKYGKAFFEAINRRPNLEMRSTPLWFWEQ